MIIKISKLKVNAIFGVYGHERRKSRDLYISLNIELLKEKASKTDKISDTVNYDDICELVTNETKKTEYYTLEKLAAHLVAKIKGSDTRIKKVEVLIDKPGAVKNAECVSVVFSS